MESETMSNVESIHARRRRMLEDLLADDHARRIFDEASRRLRWEYPDEFARLLAEVRAEVQR